MNRMGQIRRAVRKCDNALWEYRLGISTRGKSSLGERQNAGADYNYYATLPFRSIFRILRFLSMKDSDIFVDLGCGKGRALCCAARFELSEVVGVEYREDLCEQALRNTQRLRGRCAPVSIIQSRVEDFDFSRGSIYYLFNPFGTATIERVLTKMRSSLDRQRREVRVAYVNPKHDEMLARTSWLECYGELKDSALGEFKATSFWISR